MVKLYDKESLRVMQAAEDAADFSANRIQEIKNYALAAGVKRIGIANCVTFGRETQQIKQYLSRNFEVFTVNCKYGSIPKGEMLGGSGRRVMCNPAGQADFLAKNKTDLNISMGLCVGHDMIFNKESKAPVTQLFDKDFTNGHHTIDAVSSLR